MSAARFGRLPREIVFAVCKGMYGRSKRCYKLAIARAMKELHHKFHLRKHKPKKMRTLWITRINAASREHGMNYNVFINSLGRGNIHLDRKMLCALAETEPISFKCLTDETKRIMWPQRGERKDLSLF